MPRKSKKRLSSRFNWKLITLIGLVVVLIVAGLELTNTTHLFHKQQTPVIIPTTSAPKKTQATGSTDKTYSPSVTPSSGTNSDKSPSPSNTALVAPYGTFVSNHNPSASTSFDEISYCYTAPGASCYIKFTNTSTAETTRLASQTTGSDGSTSWSWNVKNDAHLGNGEWQITAVATLNDQTKSTTDSLGLKVGP